MKAVCLLILIVVYETSSIVISRSENFEAIGQNVTESKQLLLRKKRFLLFPVGAAFLVTVAFAKGLVPKAPTGNFAILELDMYHPLPDYKNRITQFKLGEISYPPKPNAKPALPPTPPPRSTPPPAPAPPPPPPPPPETVNDHHHYANELTEMELQDYIKAHPDTWVPPGYGKDRSDWFPADTYNSYSNYQQQPQATNYIPFDHTMWDDNPSSSYRMKRSSDDAVSGYHFEEEIDRYNISHHRDWDHYHHYREKRDLFNTLERALGEENRFQMKSCIMRAICEARSLLVPGRSMITDILRVMFSVPLKDDLQDEYSEAMRHDNMDCHEVYGKDCSVSILYLLLFGKFVP